MYSQILHLLLITHRLKQNHSTAKHLVDFLLVVFSLGSPSAQWQSLTGASFLAVIINLELLIRPQPASSQFFQNSNTGP